MYKKLKKQNLLAFNTFQYWKIRIASSFFYLCNLIKTSFMSKNPYLALRLPEFRYYLAMRFCITLAVQIESVVVGWQVYQITQDPLSLGLIGLVEAIPAMTVTLFAGHLVDISNRRNIILITYIGLFFSAIALTFSTFDSYQTFILSMGVSPTLPIYLAIFITGLARGFLAPANFAFMSQIVVNKEEMSNAITWNSSNWQIATIGGPALAGLLYGFLGITVTYCIQTFLVLLSIIFCLLIASKPVLPKSDRLPIKQSLREGIAFVFSNQLIISAISLDLFAVLFGGAVALLPIFASDILHVGAEGLGFLRSAPAIGSVLMMLFLTYRPIKKQAGGILLWSVGGFGICMILFALSTSFWLSLFLLALSGAFDSVSVLIRSTLLQTLTPENMKGRVSAVNSIFIGSSNEIGAFESGVAAKWLGTEPSVIFGGCMTILVVIVTSLIAKKLRKLDL
jgi:MFS family permease